MSISPLGVTAYSSMAHFRYVAKGTEVLCAVIGPYDSRASKKASFSTLHIDVVISALSYPDDTSQVESHLKSCLESVISCSEYPYLTLMVNIQVIRMGQEPLLPACTNAAYRALLDSGLALKHGVYAEEVGGTMVSIVPGTDLIVQSIGAGMGTQKEYAEAVRTVYRHSKNVPLPEAS